MAISRLIVQELGDEVPAVWEVDAIGDAQHPWAFVNSFVLARPDDNTVFTFSTSSHGGINAIGELSQDVFSREFRAQISPSGKCWTSGSYSHSDPRVGKVKVPEYSMWSSTWTPRLSMRRAANLRCFYGECPTSTKIRAEAIAAEPSGSARGPPPIERNGYNPIDDDIPF